MANLLRYAKIEPNTHTHNYCNPAVHARRGLIIIVRNKGNRVDIVLWIYLLLLFQLCIASGMWLNRLHSVAFFACQQHSLRGRCRYLERYLLSSWYQKGYLFIQLFQNVRPYVNKLPLNFCDTFYSRFLPPVAIAIKCIHTR